MLTLETLKRISQGEWNASVPDDLARFWMGDIGAIEDYPSWFLSMVETHVRQLGIAARRGWDHLEKTVVAMSLCPLIMGWNLCERYYRVDLGCRDREALRGALDRVLYSKQRSVDPEDRGVLEELRNSLG